MGCRRMRRGVRLAIDWGDARIGVAACDRDGVLAYPLDTVPAGANELARLLRDFSQHHGLSRNRLGDSMANSFGE